MLETETYVIDPVLTPGLCHADNLTEASAKKTAELLVEKNDKYHIFFTMEDHMGVYLHNHIAHHDITLWAMGASPETLESQHRRNSLYMRDAMKIVEPLVLDLEDDYVFKRCLGKEEHMRNFVRYFMNQISKHGYQYVMQKYVLDRSPLADEMHCHLYMGYVHGLIHIGLAFEFQQPLLLAEGLAQAAVHHDWWYADYLSAAEEAATRAERADPKISTASAYEYHSQTRKHSGRWTMDKEIARDGILPKAKAEMVRLAARWRVDPDNLEKHTAELVNAALYLTAGAQRPPYECAFDFWLLYTLTASIGHVAFLQEPSFTKQQKARLLEYSGRVFMMTYAGMGCPEPRLDWLCAHRSKLPDQGWADVFARACLHEDDGHMAKMIWSTKLCEDICKPYDHLPEIRVKQHMFLPAGIAMIDSGTAQPMTWTKHWDFVRGAGWEEAWKRFPKREC